jgi:hypothetical protein
MGSHRLQSAATMRTMLGAAALGLLVGCASSATKSTTYSNPEFAGRRFKKVLVFVKVDDVGVRKQMEDGFVADLRGHGIDAFSGLAIWAVGEDPNSKEARLAENAIDSVLLVQVDDSGVSAARARSTPTMPNSNVNTNPALSHGYQTITGYDPMNAYAGTRSPGSDVSIPTSRSPYAMFSIRLVDVATKRSAWVDQAKTSGNGAASFDTLRASFIETTGRDLIEADLLVRSPTQAR